jgi:hypothetical protein
MVGSSFQMQTANEIAAPRSLVINFKPSQISSFRKTIDSPTAGDFLRLTRLTAGLALDRAATATDA